MALLGTVVALVLLFSYKTSTSGPAGNTTAAPPGVVKPPDSDLGTRTVTVNGTTVDNGFGPVQVQVQIVAGKITDVTTLALPQDRHSRSINAYAVPRLRQEALAAQSARVDTVSGATATSRAYAKSLQAALDAAHRNGS
jgi:uncharacterized protein with FMN-binding domain